MMDYKKFLPALCHENEPVKSYSWLILAALVAMQVPLSAQSVPAAQQVSVMFKYVLPDGRVHPSYPGDAAALAQKFSPAIDSLGSTVVRERLFAIDLIDKQQIPTMNMKKSGGWTVSNAARGESRYAGADFSAKGFKSGSVVYYRYQGKNPFFGPESSYNKLRYRTADGEKASVMERFNFYRWTGETLGQKLDTYMIALDTYTGLIFAYGKISVWKELFGHEVPIVYTPLDLHKTAGTRPRAFYEYDPAGYLAADGTLVLYDWYVENTRRPLKAQLETPLPTGKSPYYGQGYEDAVPDVFEKAAVSGKLTVTLSWLKNLSFTGTSFIFGLDNADFVCVVRANKRELVNAAEEVRIKKGDRFTFSGAAASFTFDGEEVPLIVELDSKITKVNGAEVAVTDFAENAGMPVHVYFDRASGTWKTEDPAFELARGQSREIIIPLPNPVSRTMELCVTVSWE